MTRIVPVQQREEIISRDTPGRKNIMQVPRKDFQKRKIGSFFDESSLKEKLQKSALYVEDGTFYKKLPKEGESSQAS